VGLTAVIHPLIVRDAKEAAGDKAESGGCLGSLLSGPKSNSVPTHTQLNQIRNGALEMENLPRRSFRFLIPVCGNQYDGFAFKIYAEVWTRDGRCDRCVTFGRR